MNAPKPAIGAVNARKVRQGETTRFAVDGNKGYLTVMESMDGGVDEVTIRMAKQGSTMAGMMDALGAAITLALEAGAPLDVFVSKFAGMLFAPAGATDDPDLPVASS